MRLRSFGIALVFACAAALLPASGAVALEPGATGIVVLHGKHGNPGNFIAGFAASLRQAGFLVSVPELSWSKRRGYDAHYLDALAEVGRELAALKAQGAERVVLVGHSMGAGAALAYAARNAGGPAVDALVCLAPGHTPETGKQFDLLGQSVAQAREFVAQGRADASVRFPDLNVGGITDTRLPADVFLSYFDPKGPAVMPLNAALVRPPLPVLWVVGAHDRVTRPPSYVFDRLPPHPGSRYEVVDADHLDTVRVSAPRVAQWLGGL